MKHIAEITVTTIPRDIEVGMFAGFAEYPTKPQEDAKLVRLLDHYLVGSQSDPS